MRHAAHRSSPARRLGRRQTAQPGRLTHRRVLSFEPLEDRRLLAVFTVDNLNDAGPGSLRNAIAEANAAAGPDEIVFAGEATSGVIGLTSGELSVTDALTITGPGRDELTIESQSVARIFNVTAAGGAESTEDFTVSGLTLRNGFVSVGSPLDGGAAIRFFSAGQLAVSDSTLAGNRVVSALPSGDEGGAGPFSRSPGALTSAIASSRTTAHQVTGTPPWAARSSLWRALLPSKIRPYEITTREGMEGRSRPSAARYP